MQGGEVFVPKLPSTSILDLVEALAPECLVQQIGIRPGEKLHECLVSEDEARNTLDVDRFYVIQPSHLWWSGANWAEGRPLADGFRYTSDTNPVRLTPTEIRGLVASADGNQNTMPPAALRNGAAASSLSTLAGALK